MSESTQVLGVVSGALTAGYLVGALFFLKFWRRTEDALFAAFAGAFLLMGITAPLPLLTGTQTETQPVVYMIRLVAFVIIIIAILRKNRSLGL